jgi:two-component system, chemotaxis family, protein-glutamate methylesterase/glutaminase
MANRDIIVAGASAGGVEALSRLVKDLPADLPAALFVVLHLPSQGSSVLPSILNRSGVLEAFHPRYGQEIEPGRIYVAPPDQHLIVKRGRVHLSYGPKENGSRPAIDTLFRTAALAYGRRVTGVLLSGLLDDGTAGLAAIKSRGGTAIVQDPDDAMFGAMPRNAMESVQVDHCHRLADIPPLLVRLAHESVEEGELSMDENMKYEADIAELDLGAVQAQHKPGVPTDIQCPDCGGVLRDMSNGGLLRFRCRVGHAYSAESLLAGQTHQLESALWAALNALEEKASLVRRMANRAQHNGHQDLSVRFKRQAQETENRAAIIRQAILSDAPSRGREHYSDAVSASASTSPALDSIDIAATPRPDRQQTA